MFCPKCGYELGNDAERTFCPQCGAEVRNRVKGKNVKKFFLTGIFVFTALNIAVYVKMPKVIVENNEAMLTVYSSREQRTTNVTFPLEGVPSALMAYIKWATIKEIIIPKGTTKIADFGLSYTSMKKVVIPSSVTEIGEGAFQSSCNLKSIEIPSGVTEIGASTFKYCYSLTNVEIPSSVTEIGEHAFQYSRDLKSIEIPSSVTKIGAYAFASTRPTSIKIPSSVTEVGEGAFYDNGNVEIKLPRYMQNWDIFNFIDENAKYEFY